MNYPFYKNAIQQLYYKLNYESVTFLMARDYADKDTMNFVNEQNPFNIHKGVSAKKEKITLGALRQMGVLKK